MFLNIFGVNVFHSNLYKYQIVFSVLILITCVFNLICAPWIVHEIDDWSNAMSTSLTILQTRVIAISAFTSRLIIMYNILFSKYGKFKKTLESFDIYLPTSTVVLNQRNLFSITVVSLCLVITLPINCIKLYNLYHKHPDGVLITTYFFFFYLQNVSMCFVENHFVNHCFTVYTKFREINDDLKKIRTEHTDFIKFPFAEKTTNSEANALLSRIIYDKDFYSHKNKKQPLANIIELLKIRHWLTREAVNDLNHLFGIHLGFSILSLSVMMLFDVYTDVFHYIYYTTHFDKSIFRSNLLFFGWVLQYSFRFCVIATTANTTIKQV